MDKTPKQSMTQKRRQIKIKISLRQTKMEIHHTKTYRIKQAALGEEFMAIMPMFIKIK